jgi:hypothetical protein
MRKVNVRIVATFGLLALVTVGGSFVQAQTAAKQSSAPKQSGASMSMSSTETTPSQAMADKAAAKIQASASEKKTIVDAVRTKNIDIAKAVLLRNGYTAKQLEGAKIVLNDNSGDSGGTAEKIKITIKVSYPPLVITITISL